MQRIRTNNAGNLNYAMRIMQDLRRQTPDKHFKHPRQQVKQHGPVELEEQTELDVHDSSLITKMDCHLRTTGIIRYTSITVCPLKYEYKEGQRQTEHTQEPHWKGMISKTKSLHSTSIGEREDI